MKDLLILCLLALGMAYLMGPCEARAEAPSTIAAIRSLLEPGNPLLDERAAELEDIAAAVDSVSEETGVPRLLLVAMAHYESRFLGERVGSAGERGLVQVHGRAAYACDLKSPRGQLLCGARWLERGAAMCGGDWQQALVAYACGACAAPESSASLRRARARFSLWQRLEKQ